MGTERRGWELREKGMGTEREGDGNWERRGWELGEKGMGTGREKGMGTGREKGMGTEREGDEN